MDVTAVVLAGGMGTRLRTVVADKPKVLAPVAGRPFLAYLLDQLRDAGIRRVVLSTGHLAEQFSDAIGDSYRDMEVAYAEEESPLGTGGAIKFAGGLASTDHLLVMNGDSYFDVDLAGYLDWHRRGRNDASLLLVRVPDAARYGAVVLDDDGRVTAFLEKQSNLGSGLINAGIYALRREMLARIPDGKCSIERDVFPKWLGQFQVNGLATDGEFIDIGIPEDYHRSHEFIRRVTRATQPAAPAVFLDRDGTVNREVHHLSDPAQLELLPGAAEGLRQLAARGCPLVIVSNQSPIGRGKFTEQRLREIHARLAEMLRAEGVEIAGWYWCPHLPDDGCTCRKPAPGMFLRAAAELGIILENSWIVGDRLSDMQAGREVGARSILVATGYGQGEYDLPARPTCVDYFVPTLREAADIILRTATPPA
jgi:D-glycero-alpha-D-manno-heptose 1-phosphate guanylyltransferase